MDKKDPLERIDPSKRALFKRLAIGTAFAVPTMVSFDMKSLVVHVGNHAYAASGGGGGEG